MEYLNLESPCNIIRGLIIKFANSSQ